jgi:thiamine biosynthesis lipoprotein
MYTLVAITVAAEHKEQAELAIDAAFDEIRSLEELLSFWSDESEIALINRSAGMQPVAVSPQTLELVKRSLYIAHKTSGAFDPTVGPVIRLWDFTDQRIPEAADVAKLLPLVDYRKVRTNDASGTAFLADGRMSFDTGGIAKGYAADRAVAVLKAQGIKAALVAVAGDIRAFGRRSGGKPWRVGIRDPRSEDRDALIATLELDADEAISTSGDYERFFVKDGVRYHHILDPRTGGPARGSMSVTVVAPEAVLTDGFATGLFVLGPTDAMRLIEREPALEGVIITDEGRRMVSSGLNSRVRWER